MIGLDEAWIGFDAAWQPPLGWMALTAAYAAAVSAWTVALARLEEPRSARVVFVRERPVRSVDAAA